MLQMRAIFAELERSFIRERTMAGLEAARAQGRFGGDRRRLTTRPHNVPRIFETPMRA
ncbi:recombinase family protein [Microbacterium maritypicum]|uniref:Recombinase family protein n=1 Tax=Microbacterium maritypicum TaxID=33918 RepID=A0AAD3ZZB9_MICMQ|nr:recombinase family protein [Microbacterium liquefaciens]KAB1886910.1 recombinase family protein [Microbacterium liquefaciens]